MKLIFFLIATWLLNSSKWLPIQKKLVAIFKGKQNLLLRCHCSRNLVREKIFNVLQSGH